jgi:tetratricopeptide (TPR) repeat protein
MRLKLSVFALALALAACDRGGDDPQARNLAACVDISAAPATREPACTAVLESGEIGDAMRAEALANRGHARSNAGDVTNALRDFEAALRLDANHVMALQGRAEILLASGQLDAAELLIDRLIANGDALDHAQLMKGDIALGRGDNERALAAYDAAIERNRDLAEAFAHRGTAKWRLNDIDGALADYDAAIRLNGTLADARAGRCWLSVRQNRDLDRARTDGEAAVAADVASVQGHLCLGVLRLRGEEWGSAREAFDAALRIEPGNPTALFGRGVARRRAGDGEGREDMNQARDFDRHVGERFDELGVDTF